MKATDIRRGEADESVCKHVMSWPQNPWGTKPDAPASEEEPVLRACRAYVKARTEQLNYPNVLGGGDSTELVDATRVAWDALMQAVDEARTILYPDAGAVERDPEHQHLRETMERIARAVGLDSALLLECVCAEGETPADKIAQEVERLSRAPTPAQIEAAAKAIYESGGHTFQWADAHEDDKADCRESAAAALRAALPVLFEARQWEGWDSFADALAVNEYRIWLDAHRRALEADASHE